MNGRSGAVYIDTDSAFFEEHGMYFIFFQRDCDVEEINLFASFAKNPF